MSASLHASALRTAPCAYAVAWLVFAFGPAAAADALHGRVLHVVDGTTLEVLVGRTRMPVRLADIEVPDASRAHAQRSRQSLIQVCGGEIAAIFATGTDREGRMVARVVCNGSDANAAQVRRGMARLADRSAAGGSALHALQAEARAAHRGLWAEAQANP